MYASSLSFLLLHLLLFLVLLHLVYLTYLLLSSFAMPIPRYSSSPSAKFCDPPPFPALRYVSEYASYLDAVRFRDMHAYDRVLTFPDRHIVLFHTDVGA